jgi:hypothetical protein
LRRVCLVELSLLGAEKPKPEVIGRLGGCEAVSEDMVHSRVENVALVEVK